MSIHKKRVTQKWRFRRNKFFQAPSKKFIQYLKSFYKANLNSNIPLRL